MPADKPHVPSERVDEYFNVMPAFVVQFRDRMLHWVASADHLVGRVASATAIYEEQAVFVVRLAGILSDLRKRFPGPTPPDVLASGDASAQRREVQRMKVIDAIGALRAKLSEDELLWLELRRHEQSHPYLDGYRPEFSGDADWDTWKSKMLDGKVLRLEEVMRRAAAAESPHGGFSGLVSAIGQRTYKEVSAVRAAVVTLMAGLRVG